MATFICKYRGFSQKVVMYVSGETEAKQVYANYIKESTSGTLNPEPREVSTEEVGVITMKRGFPEIFW